jgi:hypothetical protein
LNYNRKVSISNSIISNNHTDVGLNIKYTDQVLIENTIFNDNYADQVDLDYCTGTVNKSIFKDTQSKDLNGDGLNVSGSNIFFENSTFIGFKDKVISVGERSQVWIERNHFQKNKSGITVKDLSEAYFIKNLFNKNETDIHAFQKKTIFGPGYIYAETGKNRISPFSYALDNGSSIRFFSDEAEALTKFRSQKSLNY